MKRRTPQEKKINAYVRDGRNIVAESRGIAHRAISKRKAWVNRSFRKSTKQALLSNLGDSDDLQADAELACLAVVRHGWRKFPDVPLVKYVEFKQTFSGKRHLAGKAQILRTLAINKAKLKYGK